MKPAVIPIEKYFADLYVGDQRKQYQNCRVFIDAKLEDREAVKDWIKNSVVPGGTLNHVEVMCLAGAYEATGTKVEEIGRKLDRLARAKYLTLPDEPEVYTPDYWLNVFSTEV